MALIENITFKITIIGFTEIISLENGQRKGYVLEDASKSTALLSKVLSEVAPQMLPSNGNTRQQD